MKKLLTLLLAAGMVVSAANGASAVEMKVSGSWLTSFSFTNNLYGKNALWEKAYDRSERTALKDLKDPKSGNFNAAQRIRINFDMVASESLSGRVQLQVANGEQAPQYYTWGTTPGVGGTGKTVTARLAYLDWMVPTTDVLVRMGRQEVTTPSYTFGSPVLDSPVDGVLVNAPVNDMVGVTLGWLRARAEQNRWGIQHQPHSSLDLAYLAVDVAADGFKVTPWGMAGFVGSKVADMDMLGSAASSENVMAYWVGLGGELTMFDPFKFTADFLYSANDADGYAKRAGWYAALGAEMKTSFATPFLKGWYASGDDADSKKSGNMLTVNDGGAFNASSIYFDANGLLAVTIDKCNPGGTWGVQAGVKNVSFVEDLTHALSVTYFQGTNNTNRVWKRQQETSPVGYMTTADSAWSIDFLSSYKLYQNLTANVLLAYLITDYDESLWGKDYDNGFRGTLNFTYAF